jgi:glycosyltransferase involved in cell wall biosynthesis
VETFSIAALEAMAMGKPMVMSDIGGAREQVVPGENGWLFAPGDVAALTECLKQAGERTKLSAMGAASRQRTSRLFSLDAMVENYAALIGSLRAGA